MGSGGVLQGTGVVLSEEEARGFSAAPLETFLMSNPDNPPSPQPRLNNTHTFTAAARLRRSRAARHPTPEPPETHILQSADELLKTHPALPCFLHGLELAGCCIVKRPLAWRPGCEWTRHFSICRFNPEKFSLDTRLPSRQALITAPPLLPLTPLPSFQTCIYVSRSLHTNTHTEHNICIEHAQIHTHTHSLTSVFKYTSI